MKKIAIWGDSVLKGVVLEEGKDRYSLLKDSSIELIKREYNLMIKNNSKFGLTVTKAMRLMDKSLSKGDHPNYVLVELGANGIEPILTNLPPLSSQKYFDWFGKNGLNTDNIKKWMGNIDRIYRHQETYSLALMDIANKQKCDLIDIRTPIILEENTDDFICEDGIHPNEKAHKLMAHTFMNYLNNKMAYLS